MTKRKGTGRCIHSIRNATKRHWSASAPSYPTAAGKSTIRRRIWLSPFPSRRANCWNASSGTENSSKDELADVLVYCLDMADAFGWDMDELILRKMIKNEQKYPVEKAKGNSKKYTEL